MDSDKELIDLQQEFLEEFKKIDPVSSFRIMMNSLPFAMAVLSQNRKVLFSNESLLLKYGFSSMEQVLGKKTGEFLSCLHAHQNENQCGVSQNCKVCGAFNAIKKAQLTLSTNISEMHLTSVNEDSLVSYDLRITVTPLAISEKIYLVLYLEDISSEKRKKAIERIFFHDILNRISMLNGLYELMLKNPDNNELKEQLDLMGVILSDLTDEIGAQRQLAAAENGELIVKMEPVKIFNLLNLVVRQANQLAIGKEIAINLNIAEKPAELVTNATLLNRIVTNLLKNAIEASSAKEFIDVDLQLKSESIVVSVHNKAYMDDEVQLQVFMRSFSTKGNNRGLGTYSVKLLTERYLNGKVWFTSYPEHGTTFYLELPFSNPKYAV